MADIIAGWDPIAAAKKLGGQVETGAKDVNNALGDVFGTVKKEPLAGAAKAIDSSAPAQALDKAVGAVTGGGSDTGKSAPASTDSLSTKGLTEGKQYTYQNGKLTEYTPPAAQTNFGFDPLSMSAIFSKSVQPYLTALQNQYNTQMGQVGSTINNDIGSIAQASPQAAADLQAGQNYYQAGQKGNLAAQTIGAVAGAPLDALVSQLGQASDAARLAGYEAEEGQAGVNSGFSPAEMALLAQNQG